MNDAFSHYIQGLRNLRTYLRDNNSDQQQIRYAELLQMRLEREISESQKFGGEPRDKEINRILEEIIAFSHDSSGKAFEEWYEKDLYMQDNELIGSKSLPPPEQFKDEQVSVNPTQTQQAAASPSLLPLPILRYTLEMFTLLQKAQPLVEQDRTVFPFEITSIRQLIQQNNREISPETIAACIQPITPAHTALIVAINYIKECTEEITKRLSEFEVVCQKSTSQRHRQFLQEKLDTTLYYMRQYPELVMQ